MKHWWGEGEDGQEVCLRCDAVEDEPAADEPCKPKEDALDESHPDYHFHGAYPEPGSGPCWDARCKTKDESARGPT